MYMHSPFRKVRPGSSNKSLERSWLYRKGLLLKGNTLEIRTDSAFLLDLFRRVQNGELLPAPFQRPYVWQEADVLALVDSILSGFPIGAFMLWFPKDRDVLLRNHRRRLGPILGEEKGRPMSLLLDGQNRLASFAWFTHQSGTLPADLTDLERATWDNGKALVMDLEHKQICFVPRDEENDGLRLPILAAVDRQFANKLMLKKMGAEWNETAPNAYPRETVDAGLDWWDKVFNSFLTARIVVTEMHGTVDEAIRAFKLMSRAGVPMSEEDFEAAMAWAK